MCSTTTEGQCYSLMNLAWEIKDRMMGREERTRFVKGGTEENHYIEAILPKISGGKDEATECAVRYVRQQQPILLSFLGVHSKIPLRAMKFTSRYVCTGLQH